MLSIALAAEIHATTAEMAPTLEATPTAEVIEANEVLATFGEATVPAVEGVTDADLIATAKELNASAQSFLRKSVEEFWKLGEALARLQERPSVKGRWREVLKEIGINHTSANHAQRLHAATTLEKLAGYRNKTAALRALGILSEANQAKKESPDRSSKATAEAAPAKPTVAGSAPVGALPREVAARDTEATLASDESRPLAEADLDGAVIEDGIDGKSVVVERAPVPTSASVQSHDHLTRLARIASLLEYMVAEEFEITPELAAQVARVAGASKQLWIRAKEVLRAAA